MKEEKIIAAVKPKAKKAKTVKKTKPKKQPFLNDNLNIVPPKPEAGFKILSWAIIKVFASSWAFAPNGT